MRAILPLALLAVTACYSPRSIEPRSGPYNAPADAWDTAPLQASVWYDEFTGHARFDITRPANVAIFALHPGSGVEMIYPAIGYGGRMSFTTGSHFVRTGGAPYRLTRHRSAARGYGPSDPWNVRVPVPTYILLIASEGPLDVGHFRARGTVNWLNRSAITYNPYVTLEALAGDIVTNPSSAGWTTAMHVVWPNPDARYRNDRPRYMKVQCADGIVVVVPMDAWWAGYPVCPEHLEPEPDSTAIDSTKLKDAAPKRPKPPQGWMTASLDGVDLRKELDRVREEHGKEDPGPLDLTPYGPNPPAFGGLTRTIARERAPFADEDRARNTRRGSDVWGGGSSRPAAPAARPEARPKARPEARPAPRPAPQARPKPEARPAPRPAPQARPKPAPRPAPKPKPKPKPKPDPDNR